MKVKRFNSRTTEILFSGFLYTHSHKEFLCKTRASFTFSVWDHTIYQDTANLFKGDELKYNLNILALDGRLGYKYFIFGSLRDYGG